MILTPDQRLRVFISSTLVEVAAERQAVRAVVESMRLAPVMFELGARPHPPRALYRAYLEQSHVFLAIYADKYGWVAPTMDISGLEDEYRLSGGRPKLVYVKDPAPDREERLAVMLEDVAADPRVTLRTYHSIDELSRLVADDLAHLLADSFATAEQADHGREPASSDQPSAMLRSTLPTPPTPLVGRVDELDRLTRLLRRPDVRMVTVTGMGGFGKSRLALEAAHECVDDFPGGVALVSMAEVPEAGLVLSSIASVLGIKLDVSRSPLDAVAEAIADHGEILLVLDNAEHVHDAADELAGLIATCPGLTLLVTSRKRLRLAAEHDFPLSPLGLGDRGSGAGFVSVDADPDALRRAAEDSDAMTLFRERAHAARPELDLESDDEQRRAAAELCRRLDGIPLAIELAAARVRLLPPTQLLQRFTKALDLPAAHLADLPDRQRTMRATLDWSRDLLSPQELDLFAQLSTFVSGASLDAAERVCRIDGDLLETLAALADHSLIEVELSVVDAPRFRMLWTVREYARDLLKQSGRADEVDAAMLAWVRDLADRGHEELPGPRQAEWIERLEMESGNVRVAGSRAYENGDPEALAHVGFALWLWLWSQHHTREARVWLERALDHPNLKDPLTRARLNWAIAGAALEQGDNEAARERLDDAEAGFTGLEDVEGLSLCLFLRASLAPLDGDSQTAIDLFTRCEASALERGSIFMASISASMIGMLLSQEGRFEDAEGHLDRGLAHAEAIDNAMLRAQAMVARGFARLGRGSVDEAWCDLQEGARQASSAANPEILSFACDGLAAVLLARGEVDEDAASLVGASHGLRERAGIVPWPALRPVMAAISDGVRAAMPPDAFDGGWSCGRRLDINGVLRLTRRLDSRGTADQHGVPDSVGKELPAAHSA